MKIVLLSLGITIALLVAHYIGFSMGVDKGGEIAMAAFKEVFDSMIKNKEQED
jgi:hypothetical protein